MVEQKSDAENVPASAVESTSMRGVRGVAWMFSGRVCTRLIDLGTLVILARLLTPTDFGKVAAAMTLLFIVEAVSEMPVLQAMIRLSDVTASHLDTAFTISFLRGVFVVILMAALAIPFAALSRDHDLVALIIALGFAPAFRGLCSPGMVKYFRDINFRPDFILGICGKLVTLVVASLIAFLTGSYWAIAIGTIAYSVTVCAGSYVLAPYRPRLSLSAWPEFGNLVVWNAVAQFATAINWQIDRVFLGRYVAREQLGHFVMANDIATMPYQSLIMPIYRPLLVGFASVKDDKERLIESYLKSIAAVYIAGAPAFAGLALLASPIVEIALGPNWSESAGILQFLSICSLTMLISAPFSLIPVVVDRSHVNAYRGFLEFGYKVPLMFAGVYLYGLQGALIAHLIATVLTSLVGVIFVKRLIGVPVYRQLLVPWRSILATAAMSAVVLMSLPAVEGQSNINLSIEVLLSAGLGALTYAAVLFCLWHASGRSEGGEAVIYRMAQDYVLRARQRWSSPQQIEQS